MSKFKFRGAWCHAGSLLPTSAAIAEFVKRQAELGFNALFVNVKDGGGRLFWHSEIQPGAIHPHCTDFDYSAEFAEQCKRHGVEFHAWFMDFFEGADGLAIQTHPDWAALNGKGLPTTSEVLRGRPYGNTWMCPAQRPGYTDQWLIPLYAEFAKKYAPASLHHDYVRYPGDLAPDQYCFCDYCLAEIPKRMGFVSSSFPNEAFLHELYDREYLEAHWEPSPRVLPQDFSKWPRDSQANYLLEGGFFEGGRHDLDYFFYTYRANAITEFCRECATVVRAANPSVKLSGAFFKNPVHSGRFIGQDWRTFSPYCEIAVPMNYRDHFPGTFDQYLVLLSETIENQWLWARDYASLWIGSAFWSLFRTSTEQDCLKDWVLEVAQVVADSGSEGLVWFCTEDAEKFGITNFGF